MNVLKTVHRLITLRGVTQIKLLFLRDGPQILRKPLLLQRRIARTLAHPGQNGIAIDSGPLHRFRDAGFEARSFKLIPVGLD